MGDQHTAIFQICYNFYLYLLSWSRCATESNTNSDRVAALMQNCCLCLFCRMYEVMVIMTDLLIIYSSLLLSDNTDFSKDVEIPSDSSSFTNISNQATTIGRNL